MADTVSYRERFALTLEHREVDRVPMDLDATDMTGIDGGPRRLAAALGLRPGGGDAETDEAVLRALDIDIRCVGRVLVPQTTLETRLSDTEIRSAWGYVSRFNGHHYEMVGHPLAGATRADLDAFPWPDPDRIDPGVIARMAERACFLREQTPYVVCGRHPVFGVLELGCWMCGYDDFLTRLAGDREFAMRFFEIVSDYQWRVDDLYYGAVGRYLHFTTSGDDFGTQIGPLVSPAMFRELVLPHLARRIRHIRQFTDAAFFHHSCGAIRPLIPDLIAAGVQILNPIQPRAAGMEPAGLKRDFGGQLTFYGGVDTQELLPCGSPQQVRDATRDLIATLGRQGGYVLSAAHTLQSDVPPENAVAMYRAAVS
ncbi:MAG: uroporphyrinogen decarboxylase family protein [Phycisphaerae bacterium]|nr:uroporphyrinogen decarboxylase family protein [Phycisphaerae bacterium]